MGKYYPCTNVPFILRTSLYVYSNVSGHYPTPTPHTTPKLLSTSHYDK